MDLSEIVREPFVFEWDEDNSRKNWEKHRVAIPECEDVFFNDPLIGTDSHHSRVESRYFAYGETDRKRCLFIVFTLRKGKIRVISARDMSRKERRRYHEKIKKDPQVQE